MPSIIEIDQSKGDIVMINKPTVVELLRKSENRFRLVIATSKRARQIALGSESMTSQKDPNPVTEAAQEIEEGKIIIYNSEEWKENKEKRNKDVILGVIWVRSTSYH